MHGAPDDSILLGDHSDDTGTSRGFADLNRSRFLDDMDDVCILTAGMCVYTDRLWKESLCVEPAEPAQK